MIIHLLPSSIFLIFDSLKFLTSAYDKPVKQDRMNISRTKFLLRFATPSYIPLLDIPMRIIEKYKGTGQDGKLFNLMNSPEVNLYLKDIAKAAGIEKRLSYHCGRHSFSTSVCLSQGVPIETLSQMLGHTNIKTTQIYAEVTITKINEDMTNLAQRIEGKYELAYYQKNQDNCNNL